MKNGFLGASLLVVMAFGLNAQSNDYDKQVNVNAIGTVSSNTVRPVTMQYQGVKGDPFLFPNFRPGSVLLNGNKRYQDILLNVDLIGNDVQFKQRKTDPAMVINTQELIECTIQLDFDSAVTVRKFDLPKQENQLCVVLFERNENFVLIHQSKEIIKADYSGAYNQGKNYDEIVDKTQLYYVNGNEVQPFQTKRKSILSLFPEDQNKLESYLKSRPFDFKNYSHLKALFTYLAN